MAHQKLIMPLTLCQQIIEKFMYKIIPDVQFQDRWLIVEQIVATVKSCDGSIDASLNDLNKSISKNFSFFGVGYVLGKYTVSLKCLRLSTVKKINNHNRLYFYYIAKSINIINMHKGHSSAYWIDIYKSYLQQAHSLSNEIQME